MYFDFKTENEKCIVLNCDIMINKNIMHMQITRKLTR